MYLFSSDSQSTIMIDGDEALDAQSFVDSNSSALPSYMNNNSTRQAAVTMAEAQRLSDEELLLRYRDTGDRAFFDELVHRYERELFNYLRRYLGSVELAEDVFQATFLQLHLKCQQYEEGRQIRPWLYTIATNQAIDMQRRNRRHRAVSLDGMATKHSDDDIGKLLDVLISRDVNPMESAGNVEDANWVQQAIAELPEPMRTALNLVYYQGLKYREAADVLSVPVGTVKSRVHGAILRLTEAWKDTHQNPNSPN